MNKEIIFLANHITYFVSHRLAIAEKLKSLGYEVTVITGRKKKINENQCYSLVRSKGIKLEVVEHFAGTKNILSLLTFLMFVIKMCRQNNNKILHCISTKSAIVGLAAAFITRTEVVCSFSGLGLLFQKNGNRFFFKYKIFLIHCYFRFLLKFVTCRFIVQNQQDKAKISETFLVEESIITLTKGSGVVLDDYVYNINVKRNVVLMASRLLKSKGVFEYIAASKMLSNLYPDWTFLLAGEPDADSPDCVDYAELMRELENSNVEWIGHQANLSEVLQSARIFTLPSYYNEGFPKVLIEASACGCAIVTTNTPGCRDAINNGQNGILISPRSAEELFAAIEKLILDNSLSERLAKKSNHFAKLNFSIDDVFDKYIEVYHSFR